jgi:hypothetical protein
MILLGPFMCAVKDLGAFHFVLTIEVRMSYDRVTLTQEIYVHDHWASFGMTSYKATNSYVLYILFILNGDILPRKVLLSVVLVVYPD